MSYYFYDGNGVYIGNNDRDRYAPTSWLGLTFEQRQARMLDHICPYCWAMPEHRCVTVSGKRATYTHMGRWDIARGTRAAVWVIREEPW